MGANHRDPIRHSGPPNSSSRGQSGLASPVAGSTRCRFHQPERSVAAIREPSGAHSAWQTDSSGPPMRVRTPVNGPLAVTSAIFSSVPSHGMRGWSQAIQTARCPSGESLGPVTNRCRSVSSSRTASRFSAALPSSGTAAGTRRTSVGPSPVNSSRTHQTSPVAACTTGSTQRSPPPTPESGVSGRGSAPGRSGS